MSAFTPRAPSITTTVEPSTYTLPIASISVLGGVKVGAGLAIGGDGVLSATISSIAHNDLTSLQGGTSAEYYHLTSAQHTIATQAASSTLSGYLSSTDWNTFNSKQPAGSYEVTSAKGAANGYAPLGADSKIPSAYIPALAITEYLGNFADTTAALADAGVQASQKGDWFTVSTSGGQTWIVTTDLPTLLAHITKIASPTDVVTSVNGYTGVVSLAKADIGLGNLNNPSHSLTFTTSGITTLTVPTTGTLATLAGTEELTNKTLNASVAKGTWTASGTWTLPALTLGGNVSSSGNPSLNIGTGALTAGSGTFSVGTKFTGSATGGVNTDLWVGPSGDGGLFLNSPTGEAVYLGINNNWIAKCDSTGLAVTGSVSADSTVSAVVDVNSTNANGSAVRFKNSGTVNGYVGSAAYIVSGGALADFGINVAGANNLIFGTNDTARMTLDASGRLILASMPTSDPGIPGALWRDGVAVKVSI